jgi:hypothetical protein
VLLLTDVPAVIAKPVRVGDPFANPLWWGETDAWSGFWLPVPDPCATVDTVLGWTTPRAMLFAPLTVKVVFGLFVF